MPYPAGSEATRQHVQQPARGPLPACVTDLEAAAPDAHWEAAEEVAGAADRCS